MANPIDWLGLPGTQQTNLMAPAIGVRPYSLTAADALALGRESADIYKQGAEMQRLQMEQALAPQRFDYEQNKLAYDTARMLEQNAGRDSAISIFGQLDPTRPEYLQQRQQAIAQNPYSLLDPTVKEIISSNDRAYDDFLAAKRLEAASGTGGALSPTQIVTVVGRLNSLEQQLAEEKLLGIYPERIAEIQSSIDMMKNLLRSQEAQQAMGAGGAYPPAPGGAYPPAPGVSPAATPQAPGAEAPAAPNEKQLRHQRVLEMARNLASTFDPEDLQGEFNDLVNMSEAERRAYFMALGYTDLEEAEDTFKALQGSQEVLERMRVSMRKASAPDSANQPGAEFSRGGFTIKKID